MQTTQNNNKLPYEVLLEIFKNLIGRKRAALLYMSKSQYSTYCIQKDLKTFSNVCKSWKYVAHEYFSKNISLEVILSLVSTLSNIISQFGCTVKSLTLTSDSFPFDDVMLNIASPDDFLKILKSCPNLVSLQLLTSNINMLQCMKILLLSEIELKNIRYIYTNDSASIDNKKVYYSILIRHSATIKKVKLIHYEHDFILKTYGGLNQFLLNFSKLVYLELTCNGYRVTIDIKLVIESAPLLQKLKVFHAYKITADFLGTNTKKHQDDIHLIKLRFHSDSMNIKLLKYITSNLLNNVDYLFLYTRKLVPDKNLSEKESKIILNDFKVHVSRIRNATVKHIYENKPVDLQGRIRVSWDNAVYDEDETEEVAYYEYGYDDNDYYIRRLSNNSDDDHNYLWRLANI